MRAPFAALLAVDRRAQRCELALAAFRLALLAEVRANRFRVLQPRT